MVLRQPKQALRKSLLRNEIDIIDSPRASDLVMLDRARNQIVEDSWHGDGMVQTLSFQISRRLGAAESVIELFPERLRQSIAATIRAAPSQVRCDRMAPLACDRLAWNEESSVQL